MAFADTPSGRINPKSLGATLFINGAVIAMIATMVPTGIAEIDNVIPLIDVRTPAPPKAPETPPKERKPVKDTKQTDITQITAPATILTGPKSDNTADVMLSGGDIIIPGAGTGATIIDPPPQTHDIVRTGAKLDPRFAAYLQPSYPRGALHDGAEGRATVRVLVGADGRVKDVLLIRADRPDFFEATREQALRKWRFTPATEDGAPVENWREMTVRFEMPEGA